MRNQDARPRLRCGRRRGGGKKSLDHALHFTGVARVKTAGHGGRTNVGLVRVQPAVNRIALEHPQLRIVIFPSVGRQAGLDADLLQECPCVEPMVHGHAGQQQSAGRPRPICTPCLPMTIACTRSSPRTVTGSGPQRIHTSMSRWFNSEGVMGGKRGSSVAARSAAQSSAFQSGTVDSICPQQERSLPARFRLTNAP